MAMINNFFSKKYFVSLIVSTTVLLIASCTSNKNDVDVSEIKIEQKQFRFEQDLFAHDSISAKTIVQLRNTYGTFFDLFTNRVIHLPPTNDTLLAANLNAFVHDKDVHDIFTRTKNVFTDRDVKNVFEGIENFCKYLKYYFPEKNIPNVVTYVSAFNYNVVTTDSILGIGLDMYLGRDCEFYPSLQIPEYMYKKYSKEYLVNDCIKGWFQSEYDVDLVKKELLSHMIYYGKLLHFTDLMSPQEHDTIKIGYSAQQLKWCNENESQMWAYYLEQKLLYNTNEIEYMKYISDGNTTQGFPKGAPAKTAQWIGWQIVKAYMQKNDVSLQQLLNEKDAQKILNESGYKPAS